MRPGVAQRIQFRNKFQNARGICDQMHPALGVTGEFGGLLREGELILVEKVKRICMGEGRGREVQGCHSRYKNSLNWGAGRKLMPPLVQSQAALLETST